MMGAHRTFLVLYFGQIMDLDSYQQRIQRLAGKAGQGFPLVRPYNALWLIHSYEG